MNIQINRRLVEKANQVSDMDKTIRQVIRKLQARDVDLGFCNAELRRVQAELKVSRVLYIAGFECYFWCVHVIVIHRHEIQSYC